MKKLKAIIFIIVVVSVFSTVIYIRNSKPKSANSKSNVPKETKKDVNTVKAEEPKDDTLRFSVLGDVHGNIGRLDNAIKDLYSINNNMDAMVLNGDNVDEGLPKQYAELSYTLIKNDKLLPKIVIKNIGNHDYFNYARGQNSPKDIDKFHNLYFNFSGEKSVYHDTWVKGYHFISLGSESGNTKDIGPVNAYISDNQLIWLKSKLTEKHKNGKPIFVFLHQHLSTSIKGWNGVIQRNKLTKILSEYPDVILFTSHTHVLLSVDNVKLNQPFTTAHTGGINYGILPEGNKIRRLFEESQGLYIEVKENKTIIKGRDFIRKTWIFSKEMSVSQ